MNGLLDAILEPAAVSLMLLYHAFLFRKARKCPMQTVIGANQKARRLWVYHMVTENHKKNVLVVQTLRNSIMESSLMATTAVLFTAALAAYFTVFATSSSFDLPGVAGHDDHSAASAADCAPGHLKPCTSSSSLSAVKGTVRCVAVLACFMVSFVCHTQSIRFLNQVNYMANVPLDQMTHFLIVGTSTSVADSLSDMMENGALLHTLGCRSFYMAFPFLLWVFGCVPMFLFTLVLLSVLYRSDFVHSAAKARHDQSQGDANL